MEDFVINFLDHVAIRVADLEESAKWYEKVLGLKRGNFPEWRNYPLFMHSGKSGVAIFPANTADPELEPFSKNVKIDHFAFNVRSSSVSCGPVLYNTEPSVMEVTVKDLILLLGMRHASPT
jgi:hypothetical protein